MSSNSVVKWDDTVNFVLSFWFRQFINDIFHFPKVLEKLILEYGLNFGWDDSIPYKHAKISADGNTLIFDGGKTVASTVFGRKVHDLDTIKDSLEVDFKIPELAMLYFGISSPPVKSLFKQTDNLYPNFYDSTFPGTAYYVHVNKLGSIQERMVVNNSVSHGSKSFGKIESGNTLRIRVNIAKERMEIYVISSGKQWMMCENEEFYKSLPAQFVACCSINEYCTLKNVKLTLV